MLVIKATLSHSSVTKIISLAWSSGFSFPCLWGFWRTLERGNVFGSRSGNFSLLTMICKIYNVWVRRSIYKNTFILSVTRDFNLQFHDWDYQSWSFTSVHVSKLVWSNIFVHFCFHVKHSFLGRCRLQWEEFWRWRGGGTPQAPDFRPLRRPDRPGLVSHSSGLAGATMLRRVFVLRMLKWDHYCCWRWQMGWLWRLVGQRWRHL